LAIGAQLINVAGAVATAFLVASIVGADGVRSALLWPMVPAGMALAGYTAFLFNQAEGRDLWQSPLLVSHTIVNALIAGAGSLGVMALFVHAPADDMRALGWTLTLGVAASAAIIVLDLFGLRHLTRQAEIAAHNLWRDRFARRFWLGGMLTGVLAPAVLGTVYLAAGGTGVLAAGGALALIGLWFYEDAWVRAGQSVPLS
jgi:formate-dependent nitrite reductase membrane component NrfD